MVSALDAIIPLVPSETSVILAGVLASTGDLTSILVILSAAGGAMRGDNASYWIGRKVGHRFVDRFFKGERRKRLDWAERQVQERGGYLIIIGRFIPGGRTVVTLACGHARDAVAAVSSSSTWSPASSGPRYAALLGYFGGPAFEETAVQGASCSRSSWRSASRAESSSTAGAGGAVQLAGG